MSILRPFQARPPMQFAPIAMPQAPDYPLPGAPQQGAAPQQGIVPNAVMSQLGIGGPAAGATPAAAAGAAPTAAGAAAGQGLAGAGLQAAGQGGIMDMIAKLFASGAIPI